MIITLKDRHISNAPGSAQHSAQWTTNMNDNALLTVYSVASCCIVAVMILGQWYDALTHKPKVELVPCSVTIQNMAKKINVTLMDECEVQR